MKELPVKDSTIIIVTILLISSKILLILVSTLILIGLYIMYRLKKLDQGSQVSLKQDRIERGDVVGWYGTN